MTGGGIVIKESESGTNRGRRRAQAIRPQREARMGAMPDTMQPAPLPSVYQLRVVVRGVSPLIWLSLVAVNGSL